MKTTLPARTADPATSHEAAAKAVKRRPKVRPAVHQVITENGPLTHDGIVAAYHARSLTTAGWPAASASSIRTRVSELVRDGLVEAVPDETSRSSMGNRAHLWRAVVVYGN